jgi:hypothetical protein
MLGVCCHEDRDRSFLVADRSQDFKAAHVRETDFQQQNIRAHIFSAPDCRGSRAGFTDHANICILITEVQYRRPGGRLIIDDEQPHP